DAEPDYWSAWTPFQMDVANENRYPRLPTGYGNCAAAVRYYGPCTNDLTNLIVVEAHETADFCGQPLAQTRVGDLGKLSDIGDISTTNAVMRGVAPGTVYLMAYLDLNNNGRRDANESWGYANQVGTGHRALYTPAGVEVSDSLALYPSVAIFIEDTDVNKNEIPDCLEAGMPGIGGAGDGADGDIDRDGLLDSDEEGFNADPAKWDTDGDGMPDGWEVVFADLDPSNYDAYEFLQDENYKALDVMAFATNRCTIVTVKNTAANAEPVKYILKPGQPIPRVGDDAGALALYETFEYPVAGEDENGDPVTTRCCGRGKEATLVTSEGTSNLVYEVSTDTEALVHAQVYKEYGFNPKTAVPVADAVNTKPFTALDKYLVIRYFDALGICDEDSVNVNREWAKYSLKPNEIDGDRDGVADGWELYVMFGTNPMTKETFEAGAGSVNSPWNYADRAKDLDGESLDLVGEFDRGSWPTDPWDVDTDKDGIDDATAVKYHIKGTEGNEDNDGDGLSNYVEYLLAEVIKLAAFDPDDPFSVNDTADIGDYFFKVGQLYVGDVFADHDRMDDSWEGKYDIDSISRYLYDANLDPDRDGWSNYAEFQAGTDPTRLGSLGIGGVQMNEYPVPTIELKVNYNGRQNINASPVVVKAWRDRSMSTIPDAVWTIGSALSETNAVKHLGVNPNREALLHLSPGSIVPNSVKFEFWDANWFLVDNATGRAYIVPMDEPVWQGFVIDRARTDSSGLGDIIQQTTDTVIGEIDYRTGAISVDFTKLSEAVEIVGDISGSAAGDYSSIFTLASSYIRVQYRAKPVTGGGSFTYYLADPDAPSADNNSLGHVKEGENVFVAFWDLDANGYYNAGEPYGFTDGVDVGWNGAKAEIELSDTSPIFARVNCSETYLGGDDLAANDKNSLYGSASGNYDIDLIVKGVTSGGKYERVRVVRTLVDGVGVSAPSRNIDARVVLDKWIDTDYEPYITEADFLRNGEFDVDWSDLASDISKAGYNGPVTSVVYRIVLGNGDASALATNNLLQVGINKTFDIQKAYNDSMPPVALGPAEVNTPSPTFTWAIKNGLGSYTAFQIVIYDAGGSVIWGSGYRRMPASERNSTYGRQYSWTAPISVGDRLPSGDIFTNATNYTWAVSVYNAKYRSDRFSAKSAFRMNVLTGSMDYGTINVAVKYFGHDLIRNSGVFHVQAFETPDFSGVPVAAGYVADSKKASVASASVVEANATMVGLKPGTYYVRAFIDTNNNGLCDEWESWGFHCVRDTAGATLFTPVSVKVGPEIGFSQTIDVYIDDCDTDQDNIPDAWEYKQKANLTGYGVDALDQSLVGYDMKKSLTQAMSGAGTQSSGLAVKTVRTLGNAYIAAMIGDVGTPDDLAAIDEAELKEGSIVISSISLDT
ncbi:MAG: hypothetical protein ILO34_08140, partial [Kiritimatiellae bacterium]|nr:hypothetical protein [Kiritimatiellia bacterium]